MVTYSTKEIKLLELQNSKMQSTETVSGEVFMVNGPKLSTPGHKEYITYVSLSNQGSVEENMVC